VNQGGRLTTGGDARVPFPVQRADTPWPTLDWPTAELADDVDAVAVGEVVDTLMAQPDDLGVTLALLVVHRGRVVVEAYGPDTDGDTTLISWSTAKSITHALTGMAVGDGLLDVDAPAPVPEWTDDDRGGITLQHLLEMRDGLDFNEEYVDVGVSHVVDMLFVDGKDDVAGYAAARPLAHAPGEVWNYSSGTTNVVSRLVGQAFESAGSSMQSVLADRLFGPLGMASAIPKFDEAGTFIGSSFVYATARDFARFGLLYLRDGVWDGVRLIPDGWADHARTRSAIDETSGFSYGAHWWIWPDQRDSLAAHGYEGQYVVVLPERDLVMVRLGKTDAALRPNLVPQLQRLMNAFPAVVPS
jgi:CubicO group peptidase (beta-lactamase class C family)